MISAEFFRENHNSSNPLPSSSPTMGKSVGKPRQECPAPRHGIDPTMGKPRQKITAHDAFEGTIAEDHGRVRQRSLIAFVKLPCVSAPRFMVLFEVGTGPPQHGVGWVEPANVVFAVIGSHPALAC